MPITRRQFELEIDPKIEEWMKKIHSFLAERKDEAFSEVELIQHFSASLAELLIDNQKRLLKVMTPFQVLPDEKSAFDIALERLVELRTVAKSMIRGVDYYAYRGEIPF